MSKLARLEKVDLRDQWKDEAKDFTPWLAEPDNIEILSEAIGMDLEVIGKEEKVGSFSADILCKDINTNRNVVIENQLEQTDHTHLGQVITYCAGLEASTFIWISSQVREEHRAAVDWLNAITSDDYHSQRKDSLMKSLPPLDVSPRHPRTRITMTSLTVSRRILWPLP